MPTYTSDQNVKSGVPLGGIGAGKLEVMPNGTLDHFTFLNNVHRPFVSADPRGIKGIPGFHFALFIRDSGRKTARLLQTVPLDDRPCVESIAYEGSFPFARLEYLDKTMPIACTCEAFSPFIPHDEKNSGLPLAIFRFKITNPTSRRLDVSLMGIARNLCGEWCVGRFNQIADTAKHLNLHFYNKKVQGHDPSSGEMVLSILKRPQVEYTYLGEWNMQSRHFVFDSSSVTFDDTWHSFAKDGLLPNVNTEKVVSSESVQLGGALAARAVLKPKSSTTITFILSWFFPNHGEGHMYENWFRSAADVVQYTSDNYDLLLSRTRSYMKELAVLKIAPWLKDALLNNLYPFFSGTLWTKKGRFGFFESPEVCPLLGTLDVRFYGSLPLALLFPQLELKEMTQFAEAQRPQGYIPHDLGFKRSDLVSSSTNGLLWKDLNAKFILLVWRDYLWTNDSGFLKKMYPFVKKAFYWLANTDKNKDFLPDHEGADTTFDLWNFYGASAYAGSIFLASLLALERMSLLLEDKEMQKVALLWFKQGRASFEKKLWQKKYFMAYNDTKKGLSEKQLSHQVRLQKVGIACLSAQLSGQWIAHLLGLGYIVAQEKVKKAVVTLLEANASASVFGAVNGVLPDGSKDKSNIQSENNWFGLTYCLASLAIYEGFQEEGLALAKKAWDNAALNILNAWNQPDMYSSSDGTYLFGDHYMRNMVAWSLLLALAKKDKGVGAFLTARPIRP